MDGQFAFRPRILERYVSGEFLKLSMLSLLTFVSLFIIVDFFEKIDRLVRAELGLVDLFRYMALKVPFAVGQVVPPAVILGILLTFGLMSRRHETMAIRTSGIDIVHLGRPVLLISAGAAIILMVLNFYVIPWSQGKLSDFWQVKIDKRPAPNLHKLEHFWYKGDKAIYNILLFRKNIQTLEGVKIYLFDRQFHLVQVVSANRAQWQGDHWRFFQGVIQTYGPGGAETGENFQERDFSLTEKPQDFAWLEKKLTEMDLVELYRYVGRLERDGYKSTSYRVELYSRISLSLTPLILIILGLGLALRQQQIHIAAAVAVGMGLLFAYWLFFGFCVSFAQAGRWPPLVAVIAPHLAFGGLGIRLLRRVTR